MRTTLKGSSFLLLAASAVGGGGVQGAEYASSTAAPVVDYHPTESAYEPVDPKDEFNQFYKNTELCFAEQGLRECLLQCHDLESYFNSKRISDCIGDFAEGLCGSISTTITEAPTAAYKNGRVSITTNNCQTSAYADALLVTEKVTKDVEKTLFSSLKRATWPFVITRLALSTVVETSNCVSESFMYYISQCSKTPFFEEADEQCLEEGLSDESCGSEYTENDAFSLDAFLDVSPGNLSDKGRDYVSKYYKGAKLNEALTEFAEVLTMDSQSVHPMRSKYIQAKRRASVDVCPTNYLWMNYGAPFVNGIPDSLVQFHFPRDGPQYKPEYETILLEDSASDDIIKDPFTPKDGLQKTCKQHYELSKALFILTGYDMGNVCYTIDGYTIDFIESGESEKLESKWIDIEDILGDESDVTPTPIEGSIPDGVATCYSANWRAQKSCVSHLSKWSMQVRCCKSYASVKKAYEPAPSTYNPDPYHVPQPHYAPTQSNPYYAPSPATLLENEKDVQAPVYYPTTPAPVVYHAVPTESYLTYSYEEFSYTKTVTSSSSHGTINQFDDNLISINNEDLVQDFAVWADALETAIAEAENVTDNAAAYEKKVIEHYYFDKNPYIPKSYSTEYKLPEVYHKGYYFADDESTKETCARLNIDLDASEVIPLFTGGCHPQSCVISKFANCVESPKESHKVYEAPVATKKYSYFPTVAPGYRALMADESSDIAAYASTGFIAGVVVVALIQFVSQRRRM